MHKTKLYKARIAKIDVQIAKLSTRRLAIKEKMQTECEHPVVLDSSQTKGYDTDNGYGRWWKSPCWECTLCGLTDRSYNCLLSRLFQNQTGKLAGPR